MKNKKIGYLIVITGASGAGKDAVMEGFFKTPFVKQNKIKQVVTCTDRSPRPGETNGIQYHFVTEKELQKMERNHKLVEPIKNYGTSNKATPRKEIQRFVDGENLIWRIDPSLAAQVATGEFFKREFPEKAESLQKHTVVFSVTAPRKMIENRRKKRDGALFERNSKDYKLRDQQDTRYLKTLREKALSVNNLDGKIDKAIGLMVKTVEDLIDNN